MLASPSLRNATRALPGNYALEGREAEVGELDLAAQPILVRGQQSVFLGSVQLEQQLSGDRELVAYVADRVRAPACKLARRGLQQSSQPSEWVGVVDGEPSYRHDIVEPIEACPVVLEMKAHVDRRERRAVEDERAVV